LSGAFEWPLLVIGVAAGVALFRFRIGVIPVILASGAAGILYQYLAQLVG
jgi:chromate transporter